MDEISTVTIGLTLLGFIVGAVIVALANQSRMRRLEEAHAAQVRALKDEESKRTAALEKTQDALARAESETRDTQREVETVQREIEVLRAQQSEELEAAMDLEDRLNAAEARLLTAEAISAEQQEALQRWTVAYGALKSTHARVVGEHQTATTRGSQLEGDLVARRQEVDMLQSRLDSLQSTLSLALQGGASGELLPVPEGRLPARVEDIAIAKAEVRALLRQREVEVFDLRSRLSATRLSVNVLAHSGAELASLLNQSDEERSADAMEAAILRAGRVFQNMPSPDASSESLASLEGIIADWFGEVRPMLPWKNDLLNNFGGQSVGARFESSNQHGPDDTHDDLDAAEWAIGEWEESDENAISDDTVTTLPAQDTLPPELMLATVKAVTSSALQRSLKRQYELEVGVAESQKELAQAVQAAESWRTLLVQIAAEDEEVATLLAANATSNGDLPDPDAVIALLRAKLARSNQVAASSADGVGVASAQRAETAAPSQAQPAPADAGAARRTVLGWLRRIDQAVQRQPRRGA